MRIKQIVTAMTICLSLNYLIVANADPANDKNTYLTALADMQKLPLGANAINPCSAEEMRWFLQLMIKNHIINDLFTPAMVKVDDDGSFLDGYNDKYLLFKGDFNNTGTEQYLLLATSLQMMTNSVIGVWQISGTGLSELNFDRNIVNNIIGNGDISSFYLHVAKPFAFTNNGKTYLRFMQVPDGAEPDKPNEYDVSQLAVCTYLWEGQRVSLIGPPNCMGGKAWKP